MFFNPTSGIKNSRDCHSNFAPLYSAAQCLNNVKMFFFFPKRLRIRIYLIYDVEI
uniref:Uncharacterized protein n=1 Tax=Anguilla anguilla TaxID=7936 RepID=A0A0E9WSK7_ANGAN